MSAIIGRYVRDGDMPSGAELCLECADYFDWSSSSRGRRDTTLLWIYGTTTCTMQGAAECWTLEALRDPDALYSDQEWMDSQMKQVRDQGGGQVPEI